MPELQRDPITRKDFLGFGVLGTIVGAILTIPPVAFVLGPVIKTDVLGESDVPSGPDDWFKVGPISEVPAREPQVFEVEFPVEQVYGQREIQEKSGTSHEEFVIPNAIWVSWKTEILPDGSYGESLRPAFLDEGANEPLSSQQIQEAEETINVLSSSCAHLGCPVRWVISEGVGEFRCPCHGGIYNMNGSLVSGPPPRGLYEYAYEIREDGNLYVRHEFEGPGQPYVV